MFSKKINFLAYIQIELKDCFQNDGIVLWIVLFSRKLEIVLWIVLFLRKIMIFYFKFVKLYISIVLCCLKMILKNTVKTTTQYNTITQFNLVKLEVFCRNCTLLLYCIVFGTILKKEKNNNTITQYKKLYFFIVLYCVGFGTIKKKNPTTQ